MRAQIQEEHRECGHETDFAVVDPTLRDDVRRARKYADDRLTTSDAEDWPDEFDRLAQMVRQIEKRVHSASEALAECPFDGYVEVATEAGAAIWTCPTCGYEHHEEPE